MFKKALAILALGSMTALEAVPLYTNTWSNTEGVSVTKQWGDAANWSVAYEPGVPEPVSAVPTARSMTKILRTASVSLKDGDDLAAGSTYFLAGTSGKQLNLTIPEGARLSLDGVDEVSWMGVPNTWVDGGVNNKVFVNVAGGTLVLGQKSFNLRPTMTASTCTGYNRLRICDGGTVSITNGYLRMWGGSSSDSQGRGIYTNIIDVCKDSTLEIRNGGRLTMGSGVNSAPWGEQSYYGAGWVNVNGGAIKVIDSTQDYSPFVMGTHQNAGVGAYLNVTDGGSVDLGGKSLILMSLGTNIITVATGGVITNGSISSQRGGGTAANYLSLVEINNGKVYIDKLGFSEHAGGADGAKDLTRMTVRIHGGDSVFDMSRWSIFSTYSSNKTPPCFFDFRLKAHAARTADFEIRPLRTRMEVWDGARGGDVNAYVHGIYRLSPNGGFQLAHRKAFELVCRKHDDQGDYKFRETYGGLIGEDMWQTNVCVKHEQRWKPYTTHDYAYIFEAILKDEAKLSDGEVLAEAKPRAWLPLPKFSEKQLDTNRTERISVRLQLVAPADGTLDLARIVAKMKANGQDGAVVDDSVAPYNVRVDLPMDELAANVTTDNVIMDFVDCESYNYACGVQPMVTNALIKAATCEVAKIPRGLMLILR